MERVIRVFIADVSRDFGELLRMELEQQPDFKVMGVATRGDDAYIRVSTEPPDVLVTDLLLPGLDGLSMLRRLRDAERMPRTVIVSAFVNNAMARTVSILGVQDYLLKPCSMKDLIRRIREAADPAARSQLCGCDTAIARALSLFGIPPNLNGRQYLEEAIRRALRDRSVLRGITKILYPDLAKQMGTNAVCVERAIRNAIGKAWDTRDPAARSTNFHGAFDRFQKAPGNAKFINLMVEYIELEAESGDAWAGR